MDASEGGCKRAFLERFDYNFGLVKEYYGLGPIYKKWNAQQVYDYQDYLKNVERKYSDSPEILARKAFFYLMILRVHNEK